MLSRTLEKFKAATRLQIIKFCGLVSLEITLRMFFVFLWNWIVSKELNELLFGEEQLGLFKGFVIVTILLAVIFNGNPILSLKKKETN